MLDEYSIFEQKINSLIRALGGLTISDPFAPRHGKAFHLGGNINKTPQGGKIRGVGGNPF